MKNKTIDHNLYLKENLYRKLSQCVPPFWHLNGHIIIVILEVGLEGDVIGEECKGNEEYKQGAKNPNL